MSKWQVGLSINIEQIKDCLREKGFDLSQDNAEGFINSCFDECDTMDENGQLCQGGDAKLSGEEKQLFMLKLYKNFKDAAICLSRLFERHTTDENGELLDIAERYRVTDDSLTITTSDGENNYCKYYNSEGELTSWHIEDSQGLYIESESYYLEGPNKGRIKNKNRIEYDYYPNGQIKSETEMGVKPAPTTIYREDGTTSKKSYYEKDSRNFITERYHKNGELGVREVRSFGYIGPNMGAEEFRMGWGGYLSERIIYKDNEVLLDVKYDPNGKIIDYTKNLPEGEMDFNEDLLNGELDADFTQGNSGVCYIASAAKSLLQTEVGKSIINNALSFDKESGVGTVRFESLGKTYTFTKEEIQEAMTRLGLGDPDFTLLCLGYEKYREEIGERVDSGQSNELLFALSGKVGQANCDYEKDRMLPLDEQMIDSMIVALNSGRGFATCGTQELPASAKEKGLLEGHDYYIKQAGADKIVVSDALAKIDIELSIDEFKEYFKLLIFDEL